MSNRDTLNALVVAAVVAVVAGAAWLKMNRTEAPSAGTAPSGGPPAQPASTDETQTPADDAPVAAPVAAQDVPTTAAAPAGDVAAMEAPEGKLPRLVDLGADKCIPCKKLAPILAELKKEYEGRVTVEFIDVWKNPAAGQPYGIRVIPTQILYDREGREVWRHEGFIPKEGLIAKFAEVGVQ
jgi:thioredoxin 1